MGAYHIEHLRLSYRDILSLISPGWMSGSRRRYCSRSILPKQHFGKNKYSRYRCRFDDWCRDVCIHNYRTKHVRPAASILGGNYGRRPRSGRLGVLGGRFFVDRSNESRTNLDEIVAALTSATGR